jgi:uncharacterized damage-inducible protein DinB
MHYQQYMIEQTKALKDEAFRQARAVPADKVEWKPSDTARSVLDICRELALCPTWAKDTIDGVEFKWDEEEFAKIKQEQEQWKTIEECEKECDRRLEALFQLYGSISDERLKDTRWLPYDGGRDFTVLEMMDYPRWNFNWHAGQIAYIQTMYGDKEMH